VAVTQEEHLRELSKGYRFDWKDPSHSVFTPKKGLSPSVVEEISALKDEPDWMRKYRLKALKHFDRRPMPWWGADLSGIDFDDIYYFIRSTEKQASNWEDLPEDIKGTWDKLGIPEAEKKYLGGVSAQYESEVVYHKIKKELDDIRTSSASTSERSSRRTTTSSRRSTPPCGREARSSTSRRACTSTSRSRRTSASTPRRWDSSSAR
jgi:hypothetical protein